MKREDLLKVYAYCKAIWSSFKVPTNELDLALMNEVWISKLLPFDLTIIFAAIDEYARKNAFCNIVQVSEICKRFTQMHEGTYIDEEQVLSEIKNAVDYHNAKENFAKLSPFTKQIVGGSHMLARWAMDESFNSVIASNLRKQIHNTLELKRMEKNLNTLAHLTFSKNMFLSDGGG